jgi:transposase
MHLRVSVHVHLLFLPPYSLELQPAEHLWPLTNSVLINQHFANIDELEEVQLARCAQLQHLAPTRTIQVRRYRKLRHSVVWLVFYQKRSRWQIHKEECSLLGV